MNTELDTHDIDTALPWKQCWVCKKEACGIVGTESFV